MTCTPRSAAALLWFFILAASAQTTPAPPTPAAPDRPVGSELKSEPSPDPVVNSDLNAETFYELLVGEMSLQGGEPAAAYGVILNAARRTNDAKLYQRAVELALQSRSGEAALQAARAWHLAQPTSRAANRALLQILLALNRLNDTLEPLKAELAMATAMERAQVIAAIPRSFLQASDKKAAASVVEQAMAEYTTQFATAAAAWMAIGRMRLGNDDLAGTFEAARRAQAADANATGPALLALELMERNRPDAEALVRKYLQDKPSVEVRMGYARVLTDLKRYAEAIVQLRVITKEKPDFAESWLLLGTLELQENQSANAEKSLQTFVTLAQQLPVEDKENGKSARNRGLAQAYLSLSQIAEERKDYPGAEAWIARIDNAEDMISAQSRRASILARQGKLAEARQLIRSLPEKDDADTRMKAMAEAQLLRDNKQYQAAYEVLAGAVNRKPDDVDLMYDQAMVAEKLDRLDEMERLLRRVIELKPESHHAYNALGFSLADRNVRVPEAKQLILKALESAPNDPFIQDSLGWAEFRLGNKTEALRILEAAYTAKPDVEISAHLGEVLWSLGQRTKAVEVWRQGQQLNRENETLVDTLKRLQVKP